MPVLVLEEAGSVQVQAYNYKYHYHQYMNRVCLFYESTRVIVAPFSIPVVHFRFVHFRDYLNVESASFSVSC